MMAVASVADFSRPSTIYTIGVGDYVEVFASAEELGIQRHNEVLWVGRVIAFSEDRQHFRAEWLATVPELFEGDQDAVIALVQPRLNELYTLKNPTSDWVDLNSICRKVEVAFCRPEDAGNADYFIQFEYSPDYHSFTDLANPSRPPKPAVYRLLELYSGAGGLSFLAGSSEGVRIQASHAVDCDSDSLNTYKLNNPDAKVHQTTVRRFVQSSRLIHQAFQLCSSDTHDASPAAAAPVAAKILDLSQTVGRRLAVQLDTGSSYATADYVPWNEALRSGRVTKSDLRQYIMQKKNERDLPVPGSIEIIAGGPPCQGLSKRSREANNSDVFASEKNSEIKVFMEAVELFRPRFVVLENVPEAMSKQKGLYYRYAAMTLLKLGYQIRTGILSAACYGAPQMRFRMFLIGALSGVDTLPVFPHPTVFPPEKAFETRVNGLPNLAKSCVVGVDSAFKSVMHPPTLIWDAFEDLPVAHNFGTTESAQYRMPARRPYQLYMRRNENTDSTFEERVLNHLNTLQPDISAILAHFRRIRSEKEDPDLALGEHLAETYGPVKQRIWEMATANISIVEKAELEAKRRRFLRQLGDDVWRRMSSSAQLRFNGPCMNHRCRRASIGAFLRIQYIPEDGGDFTSLPGVVCSRDYYCVGHTHGIRSGLGGTVAECPARQHEAFTADQIHALQSRLCSSKTIFLETGELAVLRWMIKAVNTKRCPPRHVFGRLKKAGVYGTLLGSSEAKLCSPIIHPTQSRYITIREAARIQGFPDSYLFQAQERASSSVQYSHRNVESRFRMIGNAVSPCVANMLGVALRKAISRDEPEPDPVVYMRDRQLNQAVERATERAYYSELLEEELSTIVADEATDLSTMDADGDVYEVIDLVGNEGDPMDLMD